MLNYVDNKLVSYGYMLDKHTVSPLLKKSSYSVAYISVFCIILACFL